jgi:hypothetical protein
LFVQFSEFLELNRQQQAMIKAGSIPDSALRGLIRFTLRRRPPECAFLGWLLPDLHRAEVLEDFLFRGSDGWSSFASTFAFTDSV